MTCDRLIHGLGAHAFKGVISSQGIPKAPCGALDKRSCCERERAHMQTAKKNSKLLVLQIVTLPIDQVWDGKFPVPTDMRFAHHFPQWVRMTVPYFLSPRLSLFS